MTDNLVFVLVKLIILKSGPKSRLERGGPLAVGCVFFETALLNGPRRQCVFQSAAALSPRSGTGLGKRSLHWRRRFSPFDWPAQQTGFFPSCEAASLPRMILRASLPPGSFGASLPGMLFSASLLDGVGLASRHNRSAITSDSKDGGPLTGNAVFISDQRVFALKRTAVLRIEILNQVQNDVM